MVIPRGINIHRSPDPKFLIPFSTRSFSLLIIGDPFGCLSSLAWTLLNINFIEPPPNCPKCHPDLPH
ncbi:hypothetical protein PILCRDRAFT_720976 [Piloderma croceum F 1598]|uniref:Uncharacterized protein n=1 Tax=Piloderma croceum (strain F 1598) TaxID=765440 RepID=A0A0C3EM98_PILCF|nr:hypothetical protein PILCRDRAFT_720976 [Piloderma croceum F 1598]